MPSSPFLKSSNRNNTRRPHCMVQQSDGSREATISPVLVRRQESKQCTGRCCRVRRELANRTTSEFPDPNLWLVVSRFGPSQACYWVYVQRGTLALTSVKWCDEPRRFAGVVLFSAGCSAGHVLFPSFFSQYLSWHLVSLESGSQHGGTKSAWV